MISNCEKNFVLEAIKNKQRIDGRKHDEFRKVQVNFGADWGSVMVSLGATKVLAQVSCELGMPTTTQPNEGLLLITVEVGPMAAPQFETESDCDLTVEITRTLERTFKNSRCIDLESLCITAEYHVWVLRIDITVLNHEGNLLDCCSIAALSSVAHFKRPDFSIIDNEVKVHTPAEKDPIPMVLHHYPICVSFCLYSDGEISIADPTCVEENIAESQMHFGLNSYSELCCLNLGGACLPNSFLLIKCAKQAAVQAKKVVDYVKAQLAADAEARDAGEIVNFGKCIPLYNITAMSEERLPIKLRSFRMYKDPDESIDMEADDILPMAEQAKVLSLGKMTAVLNPNDSHIKWVPSDSESDADNKCSDEMASQNVTSDSDDSSDVSEQKVPARTNQPISKQSHPTSECHQRPSESSNSEEDEVVILE